MSLIYNIYFEIASAAFLVILYLFMKLQYSAQSKINQEFHKLTLLVLFANVMDVTTAVTISYAAVLPVWVNLFLNTVYFVADALVGYQFVRYSRLYVDRNGGKTLILQINRILLLVYFVLLAVNLWNGCVFSIGAGGSYVKGMLYLSVYIVPYYLIACSAFILFFHFKHFQVWQRVSIILYLVLCFVGPAAQMLFFPDVLLGFFSIALALMMIQFTMETPDYQKLVGTIEELKRTKEEAERAEREAQEANHAKTDFLANMSHEVRTPINAILGYNEMIMKETKESHTTEYTVNIQGAGKALLSMINDILDFANIDRGELKLEQTPYFTMSMLQDIITYAQYSAQKKNLELRLEIDRNLPRKLSGDMVRIMQIYNNLISNAVKYTVSGFVELRILWRSVSGTAGVVESVVRDSGIGMREADVKRISERFSRFDAGRTRNVQGAGLGLTIVTRLLELMGSGLQIESEYGVGSRFSFCIEQGIVDADPIGEFDQSSQYDTLSELREMEDFTAPEAHILAVDDNAMNLDVFRRILRDTKIEIDTADNGEEALAMLRSHDYHMVFMDHMMPVMDGMETLERIKKEGICPNTPVIVLTANAVAGEKQMYLEAGFDDYLSKPIAGKLLKEMIRNYLPADLIEAGKTQAAAVEDCRKEEVGRKVRLDGLVDIETGMGYCDGDEDFYREMLDTYVKSRKYDDIARSYQEEDWENYRILVHALKSTSLFIGAIRVSEAAKALEQAAKENDISFIREHHNDMMADYKKLLEAIEQDFGAVQTERQPTAVEEEHPCILVVDDDMINLRIAEKMLKELFRVNCVDSGEKALECLGAEIPDLILLDVHMPDMNGFQVMERLQADSVWRQIPVIFLTADDDRGTEIKGFQAGALDFITKPFVSDIMIQRVQRILQLDRLQKNLQVEVKKQTRVAEERSRKVERLSVQIMSTLAAAIDAKDKYTNGHSTRVAEYAREIARRAGRSEQQQEDIYYVGLLHDIGKIGIPGEIINKTSRLTDEEYEIIKTHPVIGNNILKNISELQDIGVGARWHHERYDGGGYPDHLKGEEIPEVARIIGVADAYDAMTSKRSYRSVMPQEVVRGEIEKGKGSQFDPYFADVMLAMIDEDRDYRMHE